MNKLVKRISAVGIAGMLAASAAVTAFATDRLSSDKIILDYENTNFTLYNAAGERLLFCTSGSSGTSMSVLGVDGSSSYVYTSDLVVNQENLTVTGHGTLKGIDYERVYTLRANSVTGDKDTLEVKIIATNNSEEAHEVGSRIFFDTMVEDNDKAPFRIAGVGAVTTRMQFEGANIPVSFQAFDSLENPKLVGTGSFATGSAAPDIVQFDNYWNASGSTLIPSVSVGVELGDSSVSSIWQYSTLNPGESRVYRAFYGLGSIDVSKDSDLVLGATKIDGSFTVNEEGTGYNPVRLTSYINNSGLIDLTNAEMSLTLPEGVTVEGDSKVTFDKLAVRTEKQNTWTLNAAPSPVERTVEVTINAKSTETGEVTPVVYSYVIPAIQGATEPTTEEPTTVEPTTVVETTVAQPDTQAATSATKDEATKDTATKSEASNGTVKTGETIPAFAILATLIAGIGVVYVLRRRAK